MRRVAAVFALALATVAVTADRAEIVWKHGTGG
jgi:hypothetical protein